MNSTTRTPNYECQFPLDVTIMLCLGFWMTQLWTYTEARLAKKVMLKMWDFEFDLDAIIGFLGKNILNDQCNCVPILAVVTEQ